MGNDACLIQTFHGLSRLDLDHGGLSALIPPGRRVLSWHLAGEALDWDSVQEMLLHVLPDLRGIELLAVEVRDPSSFIGLRRLARYCSSAGIRLRFDHVVLDPSHDQGGLTASIDRVLALRSVTLNGDSRSHSPTVLAVLPFRPDTIDSAFPVWSKLERDGIPYQITVGGLQDADAGQRYLISEMLENVAHRASLSGSGRFYCSSARETLSAAKAPDVDVRTLAIRGEDEALEALRLGTVALPLPHPPLRWRMSRMLRRAKLDKWALLHCGLFDLLVSMIDGSRTTAPNPARRRTGRALVIGWYGTETAGDKAILGGILREMYEHAPGLRVTVASMLPFYTRQTLKELGYERMSDVISLDHRRIARLMPDQDEVLIGGGPLMDLVEMFNLVRVMHLARKSGVATVIAGCGVGPVRWTITRWAIRALLDLADSVVVRDQESKDILRTWGMDSQKVKAGLDPAINYVASLPLPERTNARQRPILGVAVRDWPKKFGRSLPSRDFEVRRSELARLWAAVCDGFIQGFGGQVKLIPMHTLHVGDDDRWFQAEVRAQAIQQESIRQLAGSYSAEQIAGEIKDCDVFLAMRYHSVLFGVTLGVPTVAIDYTRGGKVAAFSRRALPPEFVFDIATAEVSRIMAALGQALESRSEAGMLVQDRVDEFVAGARLAGEAAASLL